VGNNIQGCEVGGCPTGSMRAVANGSGVPMEADVQSVQLEVCH